MEQVEPKVFMVGQTAVYEPGLEAYLEHIGVPEWRTNAPSGAELLTEFYGRACYRSWKPGMNPNVTKVREGNDVYIQNIVKSLHGSVLEHVVVNFMFADVSRVFTHELVRHRAGTAMSQESLRYVRLDQLKGWIPPEIANNESAASAFVQIFEDLEQMQITLAEEFGLDEQGVKFSEKKAVTSALRRLAPIGLATTIGWSANMRALRHVIEMRTSPGAEVEIRIVFGQVAEIMMSRFPNLFADFERVEEHGGTSYRPKYSKV